MKIVQRTPDPFFYSGGKVGILLIHGFTGSPSELRPMGHYLKERGFTVYAPLLAGHGANAETMEKTGWQDWWQSVLDAYERMRNENLERIFVAGLSMGGCLSLMLAAEKPVDGVISMCAPVWIRDRRALLANVLHYFVRYTRKSEKRDPEISAHIVPMDKTPVKCVGELVSLIREMRKELPKVSVPALVVQAANDELVLEKSAEYIFEHIASKEKKLSWYENSTHIITVDKERKKLFQEIDEFIGRVSSSGL
ncbi:MAG: alpha/beta fold hydrolase [Thermoactinomyces sp.]|jgi:carboxylesterase